MKVSIIILNHNGNDYLKNCLLSLSQQTFKDFEIIFFDNHSLDNSVQYVHDNYSSVKILENSVNYGFAEACNKAYTHTVGKYIVLLNNDTVVETRWLEYLVDAMNRCDIATSKILKINNPLIIDSAGLEFDENDIFPHCRGTGKTDIGQYNKEEVVWGTSGCSVIIKRCVIEEIGLFDSSYFAYCEDVDFCWKANKTNKKILYVPKSIVYHYGGGTGKEFNLAYLIQRNKSITIKKHGSVSIKIRFIIDEFILMIKSHTGYILRKNKIGYSPYFNAILEMIK